MSIRLTWPTLRARPLSGVSSRLPRDRRLGDVHRMHLQTKEYIVITHALVQLVSALKASGAPAIGRVIVAAVAADRQRFAIHADDLDRPAGADQVSADVLDHRDNTRAPDTAAELRDRGQLLWR